jgi:hypothetical protein
VVTNKKVYIVLNACKVNKMRTKMKTKPMTVYQTEVITGNRTSEHFRKIYDLAKKFGAQASGNYDLSGQRPDPNAFSLFQSKEDAEEFRQAVFDKGLENAVYITPLNF